MTDSYRTVTATFRHLTRATPELDTRKAPIPADLLVRQWPTPPARLMDGGPTL